MRHLKKTFKLGRNSSHRRCLIANMLKSLIIHERIETSIDKARCLKGNADKMITLAKKDSVFSRRRVKSKLMLRYNKLTSKEAREAKNKSEKHYNCDRKILKKLFLDLKNRFQDRNGGYTRIIKKETRLGDASLSCYIEYLKE